MDFYFGHKIYFALFLLLVVLIICLYYYIGWKKKKRAIFANVKFHGDLYEKTSLFSRILPVFYALGFVCLVFAMVDLLGGKKEIKSQQKMNNVIFLLDVSNSMNAQDLQPNRLDLAKNIIINTLQKMSGDRVGIVVFGGDAFSVMPLTTDYSAAETYLAGIETSVMPTQGTDFLRAVDVAASKFKNIPKGARKIIMISDGEDNEGNEDAAIKSAKQEGINITTIGVGSEQGAPIPDYYYGQLMGYKSDVMGNTVMSKRQKSALQAIAKATGGEYIDGDDVDKAVSEVVTNLQNSATNTTSYITSNTAEHYFQYFLGGALFCFFVIYLFNPKRDLNI